MKGKAMFQRRHYEAIAEVLSWHGEAVGVFTDMVEMFERDNTNFKRDRFYKAVYEPKRKTHD
jgi:hypothetical protein